MWNYGIGWNILKEQHLKGLQTSIVGQIGHMHDDVILLLMTLDWLQSSLHYHCHDLFVCLFVFFFYILKLLQYCNYIIIVMQIKLMLLLLLLPESFRVLLCYANYGFCHLNLTGISKFKYERIKERNSGASSQKDVIVQLSIVSEMLVPFCSDDSFLLNFTRFLMLWSESGAEWVEFRRICMSHKSTTGLISQRQFALECWFSASRPQFGVVLS